jgi:glucose-1-phosphate cytidylyltransferase
MAREGQAMKTVILCGGMGTRMRDYSEVLPKPLVPVGSRPILWHLMKHFAHFGYKDFVLCLGFMREAFVDYFLNYRYHNSDLTLDLTQPGEVWLHDRDNQSENWRITLADTGLRTNTGGRLRRVTKYLDGTRFFLTYGDGLANVDVNELLDFHRRQGKLATVTAVHPAGRFGEIELDAQGVRRFAEKPQTSAGHINGGFMVFEREFVQRYVPDADSCVLEAEALAACARDRQLAAYCHEGFWQCMDTPREQQLLDELWNRGKAPWKVWR